MVIGYFFRMEGNRMEWNCGFERFGKIFEFCSWLTESRWYCEFKTKCPINIQLFMCNICSTLTHAHHDGMINLGFTAVFVVFIPFRFDFRNYHFTYIFCSFGLRAECIPYILHLIFISQAHVPINCKQMCNEKKSHFSCLDSFSIRFIGNFCRSSFKPMPRACCIWMLVSWLITFAIFEPFAASRRLSFYSHLCMHFEWQILRNLIYFFFLFCLEMH